MKSKGFTLYELIITLAILSITLAIAIPTFNKQIRQSHTRVAMLTLLNAIETCRSTAVFKNSRTTLLATDKKWHKGWVLFIDTDNDGTFDNGETMIHREEALKGVSISANSANATVNSYVSFIGTGEGRKVGKANAGALLMGTIKICPAQAGEGYSLILSRGGRTRVAKLTVEDCTATHPLN